MYKLTVCTFHSSPILSRLPHNHLSSILESSDTKQNTVSLTDNASLCIWQKSYCEPHYLFNLAKGNNT